MATQRIGVGKDGTRGSRSDQPSTILDECEFVSVVIQREGISSSHSFKEWENFIMNDEGESSNTLQICKVPRILRQDKSKRGSFTPLMVSIGPYHYGKKGLKSGEKLKILLTQQFVDNCQQQSIAPLYEQVSLVADDARKCYPKQSTKRFDDDAFIKMMVLDGCFVLQFAYCVAEGKPDQLKMKSHEMAFVQRDLLLLENQLPFCVLEVLTASWLDGKNGLTNIGKFIRKTREFQHPKRGCLVSIQKFFGKCFSGKVPEQRSVAEPQGHPVHLLDLMWRYLIVDINPSQGISNPSTDVNRHVKKDADPNNKEATQKKKSDSNWYTFRSAQELKTAGIHFRPSTGYRFTNVSYESFLSIGILSLPQMVIDDSSESLFLNLVAYEMCPNGPKELGVISYLWFIDTLIDHPEDVKELRRQGIILNYLGNDQQVADLFNRIANDLVPNPDAYWNVQQQIEKHYENKVKLWMNECWTTHFSSPWTFLAFLAAILALVLSVIQTFELQPKKTL